MLGVLLILKQSFQIIKVFPLLFGLFIKVFLDLRELLKFFLLDLGLLLTSSIFKKLL